MTRRDETADDEDEPADHHPLRAEPVDAGQPESGAPRPKARMLTAIASEMLARSQPNSASSGLMSTAGAARTAAPQRAARERDGDDTHA